jgi:hypothetical protein
MTSQKAPRISRGSRRSIEFVWLRHIETQWIDARPLNERDAGRFLVNARSVGELYKPLETETGLFENFAMLPREEKAIKDFAYKYGTLGTGNILRPPKKNSRGSPHEKFPFIQGESFASWVNEIVRLGDALRLWKAITAYEAGSQRDLGRLIKWRDRSHVLYQSHSSGRWSWIATRHEPEVLAKMHYPELLSPGLRQLQRMLNENLDNHPSLAQLLGSRAELRVFMRPQSLIAAMWLQFALAIDGNRQYRTCAECGRWFEVGGPNKRSDAETCDVSCRKRRQNKRRRSSKQRKRRNTA